MLLYGLFALLLGLLGLSSCAFVWGYLSKNANIITLQVLKNLILYYCSGFLSPFYPLISTFGEAPRKGLQVVANCA